MNAATQADEREHLPGEVGLWVLICGDIVIFTIFFLTFIYYRGAETDVFSAGHMSLNRGLGLLNTLALLTSSLFVAIGVHRCRGSHSRPIVPCFIAAILCGTGFVIVKCVEYSEKFAAGYSVATNDFYMFYFMFTGIHLLHVVIGLALLCWMAALARDRGSIGSKIVFIEGCACFWHLVDLLWIILFALFYLVR